MDEVTRRKNVLIWLGVRETFPRRRRSFGARGVNPSRRAARSLTDFAALSTLSVTKRTKGEEMTLEERVAALEKALNAACEEIQLTADRLRARMNCRYQALEKTGP